MGRNEIDVITIALRECVERKKRLANQKFLARHLHGIGQSSALLMRPGLSAKEHGNFLYDEQGLPK